MKDKIEFGTRVRAKKQFHQKKFKGFAQDGSMLGVVIQIEGDTAIVMAEGINSMEEDLYEVPLNMLEKEPDLKVGDMVRVSMKRNIMYHSSKSYSEMYSMHHKKKYPGLAEKLPKRSMKWFYGEIVEINQEKMEATVKTKTGKLKTISIIWLVPWIMEFVPFGEERDLKETTKPVKVLFPDGVERPIFISDFAENTLYIHYPHPKRPDPEPANFNQEFDTFLNPETWKFSERKGTKKYEKQIREAVAKYLEEKKRYEEAKRA